MHPMTEEERVQLCHRGLRMPMPMVKIGGVRVFMGNRIMSVNVRMRLHLLTLMPMSVVLIVNVQMFMLDSLVGVSVTVPFPNEKEYTGYHEDHSQPFRRRWQRPKDRNRE